MKFLEGVLDGTPYTITIEDGALVFQCGEDRQTAQGPAMLMDYLKAQDLELPTDDMTQLSKLAYEGWIVVQALLNVRGSWEKVAAADIDPVLYLADDNIQAAIRILLLGQITEDTP
ncbi:MAG: hypothetical protein OXU51_11585 [Candidatus Poribacteria bacterium]|nr:hypothetical protein [Candidatus Poribacteria bacterium]